MRKLILIATLGITASALADKVLDLGKSEIRGKMRGPSVEWIESGHLDEKTLSRAALAQLEVLERTVTTPAPPPGIDLEEKAK